MTITHFWDLDQGSDEWLSLRAGLITASSFWKLVTAKSGDPAENATSRKVLEQILAERLTGRPTETYQSDDMLRGSMEEPAARAIYAAKRKPVQKCGFVTRKRHGVTLGYSPDGLVGNRGLIEIKRPKAENQIARIIKRDIPCEYLWQMHVGMEVTCRHWCDFVSYCPGLPMMIERVHRTAEMREKIWTAALAAECTIADMQEQYNKIRKLRKYPDTKPLDAILVL